MDRAEPGRATARRMVALDQPDEFFPWLTSWLGSGGPFACAWVRYDTAGRLNFCLRAASHEVQLTWSVSRPLPNELPFRDGSLHLRGSPSLPRGAETLALQQFRSRMQALQQQRRLPLLEPRNRELQTIPFDEHILESLCFELLRAGATRCGLYRFECASLHGTTLALSFRGLADQPVLHVGAGCAAQGDVEIGRYGPLCLSIPAATSHSEDLDRLVRYVGYVLSLSLHDGVRLEAPADQPVLDDQCVGADRANPFLYEHASFGGLLVAALWASRGHVLPVFHADRECTGFASLLTGVTDTAYLPLAGVRPTPDFLRAFRLVDTDELDAIMTGCEAQLTELVKDAVAQRPDLLVVMGTCVSRVIGDDVRTAVVQAGAQEQGVPTIWVEVTATERDQHHRILWQQLVELFQKPATKPTARSVNLLGYGHWRTPAMPELFDLLESIGVHPNASMIPTFDIAEMKHFGDAQLNLAFPSTTVRDSLLWARPKLLAPVVEAPAPFGISGTRAWINSIRDFFGETPVSSAWVQEHFGPVQTRWQNAVRQAEQHRVGIVLTVDHFDSQLPLVRGGVPWLPLLLEMGFGLDFFLIPSPRCSLDQQQVRDYTIKRLTRLFAGSERNTIQCVEDMDALQQIMRTATLELLYTETPFDRRATSTGKIPINYLDFEMGFQGAVRTIERLLQYARTPFYRRYHQHLACPSW